MSRDKCKVQGCEGVVITKGLCDKHRKRLERHGSLNSTRPKDWGKREKHPLYKYWVDVIRRTSFLISDEWLNDFWKFVNDVKERPENHHIRPIKGNEKLNINNFEWSKEKPRKRNLETKPRKNKIRNRIYLSRVQRLKLFEKAEYKCEICGKEESHIDPLTKRKRALSIDHCHKTMKIRGVLCANCNKGLGHFKDNIESLKSAIEYIRDNSN